MKILTNESKSLSLRDIMNDKDYVVDSICHNLHHRCEWHTADVIHPGPRNTFFIRNRWYWLIQKSASRSVKFFHSSLGDRVIDRNRGCPFDYHCSMWLTKEFLCEWQKNWFEMKTVSRMLLLSRMTDFLSMLNDYSMWRTYVLRQ